MSAMGKYWCFTWNNPNLYPEAFGALLVSLPHFQYTVFQLEAGDENETWHYQGYLEFSKNIRRNAINRHLGIPMHLEKRRGTQAEARDYAMKDETRITGPFEYGEYQQSNQGRRNDLKKLRDDVLSGKPLKDIVPKCDNLQQLRFVQSLTAYSVVSHDYEAVEVHWYHGPTGTGKTRTAKTKCPPRDTWNSNRKGEWFDGYTGQKYVIIDELRAKNWPYDLMLQLLGGYEVRLPVKGGFTIWKAKVVYITCPFDPENAYAGQLEYHGSIDQLKRRITEVRDFTDFDEETEEDFRLSPSLRCTEDINYPTLRAQASSPHYVPPRNTTTTMTSNNNNEQNL